MIIEEEQKKKLGRLGKRTMPTDESHIHSIFHEVEAGIEDSWDGFLDDITSISLRNGLSAFFGADAPSASVQHFYHPTDTSEEIDQLNQKAHFADVYHRRTRQLLFTLGTAFVLLCILSILWLVFVLTFYDTKIILVSSAPDLNDVDATKDHALIPTNNLYLQFFANNEYKAGWWFFVPTVLAAALSGVCFVLLLAWRRRKGKELRMHVWVASQVPSGLIRICAGLGVLLPLVPFYGKTDYVLPTLMGMVYITSQFLRSLVNREMMRNVAHLESLRLFSRDMDQQAPLYLKLVQEIQQSDILSVWISFLRRILLDVSWGAVLLSFSHPFDEVTWWAFTVSIIFVALNAADILWQAYSVITHTYIERRNNHMLKIAQHNNAMAEPGVDNDVPTIQEGHEHYVHSLQQPWFNEYSKEIVSISIIMLSVLICQIMLVSASASYDVAPWSP